MIEERKISFVLFGATGNLALLKIWPALFSLFKQGALGTSPLIVASGRRGLSDGEFRDFIKNNVKVEDRDVAESLLLHTVYRYGTSDNMALFNSIKDCIDESSKIFAHLSVAPVHYEEIIRGLGETKFNAKLLIEKPFGANLVDTQKLFKTIGNYFRDSDVFLIDHYLGKSGLKALIEKRASDDAFNEKLNNKFVEHVTCSFIEDIDIKGRGEFYDATGAYRDVGGNHLLIMLSAVVSDISSVREGVWSEGLDSLKQPFFTVFGQYEGYRDESGVSHGSVTETYFRLETHLENQEWTGVPITLKGGKALDRKESGISIRFKDGEQCVFDMDMVKGYNSYEAILGSVFAENHNLALRISDVLVFQKFNDSVMATKGMLTIYKKGVIDF